MTERTRGRVPFDWASTQCNVGRALMALGEREGNTTLLKESIARYNAALEVLEPAGASYYVEHAKLGRQRAQFLLAQRREG
jgi:hypothetical protein